MLYYYYMVVYFILGLCMGSFYLVAGTRLSEEKSIVYPGSHCPKCKHKLGVGDLFPLFSYLLTGGKCRYCKTKISPVYPLVELATGIVFVISYIVFPEGFSLVMALIIASLLIVISVSDFKYMIIPDEVLLTAGVLIALARFVEHGFLNMGLYLLYGAISFIVMYLIKIFGDFAFKKESMGGADIKYMFIAGLALGFLPSIMVIFLVSILALPVAIIILFTKKDHILPYGPFLAIATWILWLTKFDWTDFYNFIINI